MHFIRPTRYVVTVEEAVDVAVDDTDVVPLIERVVVADVEKVDDIVDVADVVFEVVCVEEIVLV